MPCITGITAADEIHHYENILCQACKLLSLEQIDSLRNPGSGIYDGLDWYRSHLFSDYCYNEDETEKQTALKELNRLGFTVNKTGKGSYELLRFLATINDQQSEELKVVE